MIGNTLCSNCTVGCLLCDGQDCLYCDKKMNYYRVGRICTRKILDNCKESDNGENCNLCTEGYYVDYTTGKCRKATEDDLIENCKTYKLVKECVVCNDGFYLLNNACVAVEVQIDNCQIYQSGTTCLKCNDNYRLSDDKLKCLEIEFQNCAQISNIKCQQCKSGYMYYQNTYLFNFNIWTDDKKKKMNIYDLQGEFYGICAQQNVPHCKSYEEFFQCSECDDGYFLTPDKKCEIIPEERINDCFEYLKLGQCRVCIEGFYLNELKTECLPHSLIVELCKQMSPTSKDICSECEDGYYVENNICTVRSLQIENCKILANDADACQECQDSYVPNESNTQCFKTIENCLYVTTTTSEISCSQCISGYYFNSEQQKCLVTSGSKNCSKYKEIDGQPKCTECEKNYYMDSNGDCKAHSNFLLTYLNCKNWSLTDKNSCSQCSSDDQKFPITNYCNAVDIAYYDDNCTYYQYLEDKKQPSCAECKSGFYLDSATQKCFKISIVQNCKTFTDRCTSCQSSEIENYFLSSPDLDNKCNLAYNHIINNCNERDAVEPFLQTGVGYVNYNTCNQCYSPFFPAYFLKTKFCVPKNRIQLNYEIDDNNVKYFENCRLFKPELSDVKEQCRECLFEENEQLVLSYGQCQTSCTSPQVIYTQLYETTEDDSLNFKIYTKKFVCGTTDNEIYGSKRLSIIPKNQTLTTNTVDIIDSSQEKVAECDQGFLPKLTTSTPFKFFDLLSYVPAKATKHFKSKNISYQSFYNRITLYTTCIQFSESEGGFFLLDAFQSKSYYKYSYTPTQPNYSSDSDLWTNCKAVTQNELGKYWCQVCKFGFTGFFLLDQNSNKPMIPSCRLSEDFCDYGVFYQGLQGYYATSSLIVADPTVSLTSQINKNSASFLDYWVTCHKCLNSTEIPTFITGAAALKKNNSSNESIHLFDNKTNHILKDGDNEYLPQNFCDKVGFLRTSSTDDTIANSDFPIHCGVQMIDNEKEFQTFSKVDADLATNNPTCVACKPGYKPEEKFYENQLYLLDCIEITNCDDDKGKTTFNKCTECQLGYSLNDDDTKCIETSTNQQCYKVANEESDNCIQCRKGYVPDKNKQYCNKINLENCLVEDIATWTQDGQEVQYYDGGCVECDLGYIAIEMSFKQKVCLESLEISQRVEGIGVTNCYIYSSYDRCYKCNVGFVVPNIISSDANVVSMFEKTRCVLQSLIPNCKDYRIELNGSTTVACTDCTYPCTACQDGFVLVNGQCEDGSKYLTNCLQFKDDTVNNQNVEQCQTCVQGYVPFELSNGKIACSKISQKIQKCDEFITKTLTNTQGTSFKVIECSRCSADFYPQKFKKEHVNLTSTNNLLPDTNDTDNIDGVHTNYSIEICISKPQIPNCETYESLLSCIISLAQGFTCDYNKCIKCYDRYWLKNPIDGSKQIQQCILRTNYPYVYCDLDNASLTEDNCSVCQDGYYLRDNMCQTKPRGVIGCVIYADTDTCLKCKDNQYIEGNVCKKVDEENLIENCLYYKDKFTCSDCKEGYLLIDNQCKAIMISDCDIYETELACKICNSQYFLTESKTCEKGKVSNCLIHSTVDTCQQCDASYYVNKEEKCSQITLNEEITNCLFYESNVLCKFCTNGTLLSKDQKSCITITSGEYPELYVQVDSNCDSYVYDVHCKVCEAGYRFKDGVCTNCPPNLENCYFCDYYDDQVCHVCMSGFYQSDKNECITSGNQGADQQIDSDDGRVKWEYLHDNILDHLLLIIIIVF